VIAQHARRAGGGVAQRAKRRQEILHEIVRGSYRSIADDEPLAR